MEAVIQSYGVSPIWPMPWEQLGRVRKLAETGVPVVRLNSDNRFIFARRPWLDLLGGRRFGYGIEKVAESTKSASRRLMRRGRPNPEKIHSRPGSASNR